LKLAICNELFVDWPFDRAFDFAHECGYSGVEIAPFTLSAPGETFDARDVSGEQRAQVRRDAEKSGLNVVGLHWLLAQTQGFYLTSPDVAVRRATAEYLRELVRLCGELGGSILVLGSPKQRNLLPGVSHEEALSWAADVLHSVMPLCEKLNQTIAVEPLGPAEGNFLLTAEAGRELVQRVGSRCCRLHLDCKAMASESQPIPTIIHASRTQLVPWKSLTTRPAPSGLRARAPSISNACWKSRSATEAVDPHTNDRIHRVR
jgi:sugar phosphate isomerase/epimerase